MAGAIFVQAMNCLSIIVLPLMGRLMPVSTFSPVRDLLIIGSHFSGCKNGTTNIPYVPEGQNDIRAKINGLRFEMFALCWVKGSEFPNFSLT